MTPGFEEAWSRTFRYAAEHSPYYRQAFHGLSGVPALETIPPIDKRMVSERNLDFLCVPREEIVEVVTTSGTTGQPLLWMLNESDLQRLALNEKLSFDCAGLTASDTVLVAVSMERCFIAGLAYWLGLRQLGCTVVRTGVSSPPLILEMIQRLQPTAIVGVPSFLRHLAQKAADLGVVLAQKGVKKAICIGEPVRDSGLRLNASGQAIEQAWAAKVYATYGVTELANSLCECEAGNGGHLHDDQLFLESLDETGQPVPEGQVGEIVATTFGVEAMPLIRYRTGDCAAIYRGPCACGRVSPRVGPILGRKHQKLKIKGASLFPSTLVTVLEQTPGVESFVIIARRESELADALEVVVHGEVTTSVLRDAFQARARITPQIRHASAQEIESLQLPAQARKRCNFVDLR